MARLYIRGVGVLTRFLIHESGRTRLPPIGDVPQAPIPEAPASLSPTPPPARGAVGLTKQQTSPTPQAPGTSCIPCAANHLSTCAGLLSEALRFARSDGLASPEVINRLGLSQDELNAMERVDLRAEMVTQLPPAERELANHILVEVRGLRHDLENLTGADGLENLTARMQSLRTYVGQQWWRHKLQALSPEEKAKLKDLAQKKVEAYLEEKENG